MPRTLVWALAARCVSICSEPPTYHLPIAIFLGNYRAAITSVSTRFIEDATATVTNTIRAQEIKVTNAPVDEMLRSLRHWSREANLKPRISVTPEID